MHWREDKINYNPVRGLGHNKLYKNKTTNKQRKKLTKKKELENRITNPYFTVKGTFDQMHYPFKTDVKWPAEKGYEFAPTMRPMEVNKKLICYNVPEWTIYKWKKHHILLHALVSSTSPYNTSCNKIGGTVGGERGSSLAVLFVLSGAPDEALVSPLPSWTFGLSEGLLVRVLLGMDLVVQEVVCQLVSTFNLQLFSHF